MKKLLSLLLTIMIVVSSSITVFAEDVVNENNQVEEVQDTNSNNNEIVEENNDDILNQNAEDDSTIENNDSNLLFSPLLTTTQNVNEYRSSGTCGDNIEWTLDYDGNLVLTGTGDMYDYIWCTYPWYEYKEEIVSVTIKDGITNIGNSSFYGITNLSYVTLSNTILSIGDNAFSDCRKISAIILPNGLVNIGSSAFSYTKSLTSIVFPSSLTVIEEYAFYESGLTSLEIISTIKNISKSCFNSCRSLKTAIVQTGVESIGDYAFYSCPNLQTVSLPNSINSIGKNVFSSTNPKIIYDGSYSDYKLIEIDENSGIDVSKLSFASSACSGLLNNGIYYELTTDGTFTVNGSGYIDDFNVGADIYNISYHESQGTDMTSEYERLKENNIGAPWYQYRDEIKSVIFSEGILNVPNGAFINCKNIKSVQLSSTITQIGNYAFTDCEKLETINVIDKIKSIGVYSFYGCKELTTSIFSNVTNIGDCALDLTGDASFAYDKSMIALNEGIDFLNNIYLRENSTIGYDLYGVNEADKEILQKLADNITQDCSTDKEKCIAIYNWLKGYLNGSNYSFYPITVLASKKALCSGSSQLMSTLMKLSGVKAAIINGTKENTKAKNLTYTYFESYSNNHQWVMAYYENDWHLYDVLWNYYDESDRETIAQWYYLTGIDGVCICNDTRIDVMKILQNHGYSIFYKNNKFISNTIIDSLYFPNSSVLNSGIQYTISKYAKNNIQQIYDDTTSTDEHSLFYYSIRNNGLYRTDTTKIINDKYYYFDIAGLEVTEKFAKSRLDGNTLYMVTGTSTKILPYNIDLFDSDIKIIVGDDSLLELKQDGTLYAVKSGETSVSVGMFSNYTTQYIYLNVNVIDDFSKIPSSSLIKELCNHKYTHEVDSNIDLENETYDYSIYCEYCGSLIESKSSQQIPTISNVELSCYSYNYDGKNHLPEVIITNSDGNKLKQYVDYEISYGSNNISSGTHSIDITYKGKYTGSTKKEFVINATNLHGDYYSYNVDTKTLTITNTNNLQDFNNTSERPWDSYSSEIESIIIEEGVEKIGVKSFENLINLKTVHLPSTINEIKLDSFKNCDKLSDIYYDGNSDTSWDLVVNNESNNIVIDKNIIIETGVCGEGTFYNYYHDGTFKVFGEGNVNTFKYKNLRNINEAKRLSYADSIKKIIICNGISGVVDYAFQDLKNLEEIVLSNTMQTVSKGLFQRAGKVTSVIIPSNIIKIDSSAFYNCKALTTVTIEDGLRIIEDSAFAYNYALTSIVLPNSLKEIGEGVFYHCSLLNNVSLGSGLNAVSKKAFYECSALQEIIIPNNINKINDNAFGYSGLKNISFGNKLTEIGNSAFIGCSFTEVELPNNLKSLGDSSFSYCSQLGSITLSNSLVTIGENCFSNCISLDELVIPASVESIGKNLINSSNNVKYLFIKGEPAIDASIIGDLRNELIVIVAQESNSNDWSSDWNKNLYFNNKVLTLFGVSEQNYSLIKAGSKTYEEFMTDESVYASGSAGENATYTYYGNGMLKISGSGSASAPSFSIPFKNDFTYPVINLVVDEGITSFIGTNCKSKYLKTVVFPNSLEEYGGFSGCSNLIEITMPISAKCQYAFGDIHSTSNVKTIYFLKGSGIGYEYQSNIGTPWRTSSQIENIDFEEGISSIGKGMFASCNFNNDLVITLPSTLETINSNAFYSCSIKEVELPEGLSEVGATVFQNSTIKKLTIPSTLKTIGSTWLMGCSNLKSIGITGSGCDIEYAWTDEIPDNAFSYLESATSVSIADTITRIGKSAFASTSIVDLVIPDSVITVDEKAFWNAKELKTISMPISCRIISADEYHGSQRTFYNTTKVESMTYTKGTGYGVDYAFTTRTNSPWYSSNNCTITFEDGIKSIGDYQFYHWYGQENVVLPDSVEKIGNFAFAHCYNMRKITMPITASVKDDAFQTNNVMSIEFTQGSVSEGDKMDWPPIRIPSDVLTALGSNRPVKLNYKQNTINDSNLSSTVKQGFADNRDSYLTHGMYFEVGFEFNIDGTKKQINELDENVNININLPNNLKADENTSRVYYVIREHNGEYTKLPVSISEQGDDEIFTFKSDKFSTFELVYVDVSNEASLHSASLTLADDIKINMFIDIESQIANDDDSYVLIKNVDKNITKKVLVKDLEKNNDNYYKVIASVVPKELNTMINVQVFNGNDTPVSENMSYSASEYLYQVVNNPSSYENELVDVCTKMINLGTISQVNFKFQTNKLLSEDVDAITTSLQDISTADLATYKYSSSGEVNGISLTSAKISLETQTICSITYELEEDYSATDFTFKIDGEVVSPVVDGNKVTIKYASVAKNLGNKKTVTVSDGNDTNSINFCALSYVYQVLKSSGSSNNVKNVCRALYKYYLAANTYFNR